jgi:type IV pilus assembly protein PilA
VKSITTNQDGLVTVTVQGFAAATGINGTVVTLVPLKSATVAAVAADVGGMTIFGWRCGAAADGTTLNPKFLPGSCRG